MISSSVFLTFCEMLCRHQGWIGGNKLSNRYLAYGIAISATIVVSFSRIWLGVHTLNQILNGWVWGTCLYVLFSDVLYGVICRFVHSVQKRRFDTLAINFGTKNFSFIFGLGSVIFYLAPETFPVPPSWLESINKNCDTHLQTFNPVQENLEKFALALGLAFAVYLGLIVDQKWLGGPKLPFWTETELLTSICRCVVCVAISAPLLLPKLLDKSNMSYTTAFFLTKLLPPCLGNFYLFGATRWVSWKLGLVNERQARAEEDVIYFLRKSRAID